VTQYTFLFSSKLCPAETVLSLTFTCYPFYTDPFLSISRICRIFVSFGKIVLPKRETVRCNKKHAAALTPDVEKLMDTAAMISDFGETGFSAVNGKGCETMGQDIDVLALVKGEERYIFLYNEEHKVETLRLLGRYASNPELSFSWYDAAVLSQKIRQESQHKARERQQNVPNVPVNRCNLSLMTERF
jgi:hypothetical protein